MENAIGVFSSHQRAEEAVTELLKHGVTQNSILFFTRSQPDAHRIATGISAAVAPATLLVPGLGPVFALGSGAAAVLGLAGAGAGSAPATTAASESGGPRPAPDDKSLEDVGFLRDVLRGGRSLIVVRTDAPELAKVASGILDRLGLGIAGRTPSKMQTASRQVEDIVVVDITGRITLGEGTVILHDLIHELVDRGQTKVVLNLHEVGYVDSAGLGALVRVYATVRNRGGDVKLVNPSKRVRDLVQVTHLGSVFDIQPDEATAIQSFRASPPAAVA